MNARQRTISFLDGDQVDRIPVIHFGFWKETLLKWAREGHLTEEEARAWRDSNAVDDIVSARLGFDHDWAPVFIPGNYLRPFFEEEVIRELPDGSRHVRNREGVIELEVRGAVSIRSEIEHLLEDRDSWERHYKWRFLWDPARVEEAPIRIGDTTLPFGHGGAEALNDSDPQRPMGLACGSLIGWVRNMLGIEGLSYLTVDDPELVQEIIDTLASLSLRCVEEILARSDKFDYGHYWEDICYNMGPLVNPAFFKERIAPWYRKTADLLAGHGIRYISVDCDGCIDALVPIWLEAGINVMFPIEVGTWNASIAPWREAYGAALKGVGGVRKSVFARDRASVDAEIERLKPLIALGGYIPCPDHRIPPDAKWELVQYYTEQLRGLTL